MKTLAWVTVGLTFLLMTWGNIVSATGSGLACPDWPLCHGTITPPARLDIVFEWGHRLLAFTASVLIVSTFVGVMRSPQLRATLKAPFLVILGLLVTQILLGGITVLLELSVLVSTVHLLIANFVFAILIVVATQISSLKPVDAANRQLRLWAAGAMIALLFQFFMGALLRHGHAGLACSEFPACLDSFWPIPWTWETAWAFAHRWWAFITAALLIGFLKRAARHAPAVRSACWVIGALVLAQIGLGILTVESVLSTLWRAVHAATGYGIWGLTCWVAARSGIFERSKSHPKNSRAASATASHGWAGTRA